jgi:hypothetical protein
MKQVLFIAAFMSLAFCTMAQAPVRLNLYGAYVFDDSYDVYNDVNTYYTGKVKGGFQWGGSLEYLPSPYGSIELTYLHQSTSAPTTFKFGTASPVRNEDFDVSLNYVLLGGNGYFAKSSGKVEGYGGLMAGVAFADVESPSTHNSGSNTSFAWGGKLGANIWVSQKVGIKLQAQILSSSRVTGGDVWYSWWGPVYLDSYSTLWQFGLGGGLTFKFGK